MLIVRHPTISCQFEHLGFNAHLRFDRLGFTMTIGTICNIAHSYGYDVASAFEKSGGHVITFQTPRAVALHIVLFLTLGICSTEQWVRPA